MAPSTCPRRYVRSDPVVLMRAGLPRPRTVADLRSRLLCAVAGSRGAAAARRVRSAFAPLVAESDAELLRLVQTGRCDVAVREAPLLGCRHAPSRRAVRACRRTDRHRCLVGAGGTTRQRDRARRRPGVVPAAARRHAAPDRDAVAGLRSRGLASPVLAGSISDGRATTPPPRRPTSRRRRRRS